MVCWWCTKKCRLFFSFLSSSSALFSTLEDWRPILLVKLFPDHIPQLHWLYFVCPIKLYPNDIPNDIPVSPMKSFRNSETKNWTKRRSKNDVLLHLWQCLNVVLRWELVWKCCVPLNPMVLLIIIPFLNGYFIGKINPTFSDKPRWELVRFWCFVKTSGDQGRCGKRFCMV